MDPNDCINNICFKILFSLGNSDLNNKLVNDYPTQGQSLQPEQ